jgi:F-type H+-transporting ATPase subunit epsilon
MADSLDLKVVTPKGSLLNKKVASFTGCSDLGEFCILPEHRPLLASLVAGRMIVEQQGGEKKTYALDRGFLEAGIDHVNVITERCLAAEDLDKTEITSEKEELESELKDLDQGSPEASELLLKLDWAKVRLSII